MISCRETNFYSQVYGWAIVSASLAHVSSGGSPNYLGAIVYDLKQQAGIQQV